MNLIHQLSLLVGVKACNHKEFCFAGVSLWEGRLLLLLSIADDILSGRPGTTAPAAGDANVPREGEWANRVYSNWPGIPLALCLRCCVVVFFCLGVLWLETRRNQEFPEKLSHCRLTSVISF